MSADKSAGGGDGNITAMLLTISFVFVITTGENYIHRKHFCFPNLSQET